MVRNHFVNGMFARQTYLTVTSKYLPVATQQQQQPKKRKIKKKIIAECSDLFDHVHGWFANQVD